MKRASRFSVQPKGAYGSVAPPCFGGGAVASAMTSSTSIASTSKPAKDYFDDDDDDDTSHSAYQAGNTSQGCYSVPGDYDPLDDFM